jgi:hypothetical protein
MLQTYKYHRWYGENLKVCTDKLYLIVAVLRRVADPFSFDTDPDPAF